MPQPSAPPNRVAVIGPDGRPATNWQQWFTAVWRSLVPQRAFYIPVSDGAPTFTPETRAGYVALCYDITNDALYVFNQSWVKASLA